MEKVTVSAREQKLRSMRTSNTRKTVKKLNMLGKKKKISRDIINKLSNIKKLKSVESRQRVLHIEDDWVADREEHFDDDAEDVLPLDMLDADIDWENSAFAGMKRRHDQVLAGTSQSDDDDENDFESKKRKFAGQLDQDQEEMLPIKLKDGTLIRPTRKRAEVLEEDESEDVGKDDDKDKPELEDLSGLSAMELLRKRKEMLDKHKEDIAGYAHKLLSNPEENIYRLRDLFELCVGQGVHSLVRETVQKLAIASMVQTLIDVIPGYAIRELTDAEKDEKVKKDTKRLRIFEESLLRYHLKYLQLCEKLSGKLCRKGKDAKLPEESFSYKIGLLALRAMSRIMNACPHFNYTTNIISAMTRMSLSKHKTIVEEACGALTELFKEDLHLKMSLFGARSIATLVTKRKGRVPPQLISTLIHLNIKEVSKGDKRGEKTKVFAKRARLKKERVNKSARKYQRQLDKLETDLKELDAQESLTSKLKNATEAMKHVFQCYFSILKRLSNPKLLEPTLEGLSHFAHLLSVEFFQDIIRTLENLVEQKNLKMLDQLYCINTVFVVLSGDGQLLNVDPSRFYRAVYKVINHLPFERNFAVRTRQLVMLTKTLHIMIIERQKQVPLARVAAFVKRLLSLCVVLDNEAALCLAATVRTYFISHPKLSTLISDEEGGGGGAGLGTGIFKPDCDDPDVACSLNSSVRRELIFLCRRRGKHLSQVATNLLHGVPSTGNFRLGPHITNIKPWILLEDMQKEAGSEAVDTKYFDDLNTVVKKKNQKVTSANLHSQIENWLEALLP